MLASLKNASNRSDHNNVAERVHFQIVRLLETRHNFIVPAESPRIMHPVDFLGDPTGVPVLQFERLKIGHVSLLRSSHVFDESGQAGVHVQKHT